MTDQSVKQKMGSFRNLADYFVCIGLFVLLNAVVFHTSLYSYFCRVDSYAGNVYGRMAVLDSLESDGRRALALVGDSTTEEGIGAKELSEVTGKPVANLALPGTVPLEWLHFLRSVDPRRNRFDTVVFTIVPEAMRTTPDKDGIQTLMPVATISEMLKYVSKQKNPWSRLDDYYAAFDRAFGFRRDLCDLVLSPDRLLTNSKKRREFIEKVKDWPGENFDVCEVRVNPRGRVVDWGAIRQKETQRLAAHALNRIAKLNIRPVVSGILEPMNEIIQYYQGSETRILIVSIPFGLDHNISPESAATKSYFARLLEWDAWSNVDYWNALDDPVFDDCRNFYDFRHLNARGRKIFSTSLAQKIRGD